MYYERRCIDWLADGAVRRGSGNVALPRPPHASLRRRFTFFRQRPFVNDNTQAHKEGRIMLKRQPWLQWSCLTSRSVSQSVILKAVCVMRSVFFFLLSENTVSLLGPLHTRDVMAQKREILTCELEFGLIQTELWCYILFNRAWLCDALNYSAKALENRPPSCSIVRGGSLFLLQIFKPPEAVWFVVRSYISETAILSFDV